MRRALRSTLPVAVLVAALLLALPAFAAPSPISGWWGVLPDWVLAPVEAVERLVSITAASGPGADPNGSPGETSETDPDGGATTDSGPGADPNG